jgi:hypothetical protein
MRGVCFASPVMNENSPRSATRPLLAGPTALAVAAGLAFGHVVAAMAAQELAGPATVVAALVFVAAGSAGTICALAHLAAGSGTAVARQDVLRWVTGIGAGLVAALSPGFF